MEDIRIGIGRLSAGPGQFAIAIVAKPDGRGYVTVFASNSDESEPDESVLGMFDLDAWNKLRRLIRETDAMIQQMTSAKQITELSIGL
jgi:hypothetical protein